MGSVAGNTPPHPTDLLATSLLLPAVLHATSIVYYCCSIKFLLVPVVQAIQAGSSIHAKVAAWVKKGRPGRGYDWIDKKI